jgi:hypothetical protein
MRPGLNPVPGVRFLGAVGKGLRFAVGERVVEGTHFARFVWLTDDGREHHPAHELRLSSDVGGTDSEAPEGPAC